MKNKSELDLDKFERLARKVGRREKAKYRKLQRYASDIMKRSRRWAKLASAKKSTSPLADHLSKIIDYPVLRLSLSRERDVQVRQRTGTARTPGFLINNDNPEEFDPHDVTMALFDSDAELERRKLRQEFSGTLMEKYFDPNTFIEGLTDEDWRHVLQLERGSREWYAYVFCQEWFHMELTEECLLKCRNADERRREIRALKILSSRLGQMMEWATKWRFSGLEDDSIIGEKVREGSEAGRENKRKEKEKEASWYRNQIDQYRGRGHSLSRAVDFHMRDIEGKDGEEKVVTKGAYLRRYHRDKERQRRKKQ